MANMMKLMKQAAEMQKEMEKIQERLAHESIEFASGGGMVKVVVTGDLHVESVHVDAKVVDPSDVGMLEDLILTAVNGALDAAREKAQGEMGKLTSGLGGLGGLNLPM